MIQGASALRLDDRQGQHTQLSMVQESPSGLSGGGSSGGSDKSSQGLAKTHSIKRSPLGRSVVTALEAELDQVCTAQVTASPSRQGKAACGLYWKAL